MLLLLVTFKRVLLFMHFINLLLCFVLLKLSSRFSCIFILSLSYLALALSLPARLPVFHILSALEQVLTRICFTNSSIRHDIVYYLIYWLQESTV